MSHYELTRDITAAVEQHLPQQVGDMLKKRLTEADADKTELARANLDITSKRSEIIKLQEVLAVHAAIDKRTEAVGKREADVTKRELQAELNEYKVKAEVEKREMLFGLVDRVFRNPQLTTTKSTNETVPVNTSFGVTQSPSNKNEFTTVEQSR